THEDGPLLIVAGPGTGKTKTLTTRIAYLIRERGVAPSQIMAITFSNRAANELRERLQALLPEPIASEVSVGTFHAVCWQILRQELGANWSLCTEDAQLAIVRRALGEASSDAARVVAAISRLKGRLCDVASEEL